MAEQTVDARCVEQIGGVFGDGDLGVIGELASRSTVSVRSNLAVPPGAASGVMARPGAERRGSGAFCSTKATWNTGVDAGSRTGCSSSTNSSNGSSW